MTMFQSGFWRHQSIWRIKSDRSYSTKHGGWTGYSAATVFVKVVEWPELFSGCRYSTEIIRVQFVRSGSRESSVGAVTCWVPQRSVLGPLLFISYIDDVSKIISYCCFHLKLKTLFWEHWSNRNIIPRFQTVRKAIFRYFVEKYMISKNFKFLKKIVF
jgi:hypothetical protein